MASTRCLLSVLICWCLAVSCLVAVTVQGMRHNEGEGNHMNISPRVSDHERQIVIPAFLRALRTRRAAGGAAHGPFEGQDDGDDDEEEDVRALMMGNVELEMPKREYGRMKRTVWTHRKASPSPASLAGTALPDSLDWRDIDGVVSGVRDQGSAGTCWAFSATGQMASALAIDQKKPAVDLSVQQIVACDESQDPSKDEADCGVFGGFPSLAFSYVERAGGITTESAYPYCGGGEDGKPCFPCYGSWNATACGPPVPSCRREDSCPSDFPGNLPMVATVSGWEEVGSTEEEVMEALIRYGPLSVLIDATLLQFYRRGVFPGRFCQKLVTDHAVLLIGYGTEKTIFGEKKYWLLQNSWGRHWGEKGYFRLERGVHDSKHPFGVCNILIGVTHANVASP